MYYMLVHVAFVCGLKLNLYGSTFITPLYAYVSEICPLLHSLLSTMPCFSPCQPLLASGLKSKIRCKLCWRRCPKEGILLYYYFEVLQRTIIITLQQHVAHIRVSTQIEAASHGNVLSVFAGFHIILYPSV